MPNFCSAEGCGVMICPGNKTGLCQKHYYKRGRNICSSEGCKKVAYSHGLCMLHWQRKKDHGTLLPKEALVEDLPGDVLCVETGRVYSSKREAARQIGRSSSRIMEATDKPNLTAGGFHWRLLC